MQVWGSWKTELTAPDREWINPNPIPVTMPPGKSAVCKPDSWFTVWNSDWAGVGAVCWVYNSWNITIPMPIVRCAVIVLQLQISHHYCYKSATTAVTATNQPPLLLLRFTYLAITAAIHLPLPLL